MPLLVIYWGVSKDLHILACLRAVLVRCPSHPGGVQCRDSQLPARLVAGSASTARRHARPGTDVAVRGRLGLWGWVCLAAGHDEVQQPIILSDGFHPGETDRNGLYLGLNDPNGYPLVNELNQRGCNTPGWVDRDHPAAAAVHPGLIAAPLSVEEDRVGPGTAPARPGPKPSGNERGWQARADEVNLPRKKRVTAEQTRRGRLTRSRHGQHGQHEAAAQMALVSTARHHEIRYVHLDAEVGELGHNTGLLVARGSSVRLASRRQCSRRRCLRSRRKIGKTVGAR